MKRTRIAGVLILTVFMAAMTGCRGTAPENSGGITTETAADSVEDTSKDASGETSADAAEAPLPTELTGIDDNTVYVYPSSDQLTPHEVVVTDDEAKEIIGFINAAEKEEGTIASDSNIYFKNNGVSVNIASYDSSVNVSDVCGTLAEADTSRLIEIIKTESGIDLAAYLD